MFYTTPLDLNKVKVTEVETIPTNGFLASNAIVCAGCWQWETFSPLPIACPECGHELAEENKHIVEIAEKKE